MNALKYFNGNANSLSAVASTFANTNSLLSEHTLGGVAASMNKWLDPENGPLSKALNPELSAVGKQILSPMCIINQIHSLIHCKVKQIFR